MHLGCQDSAMAARTSAKDSRLGVYVFRRLTAEGFRTDSQVPAIGLQHGVQQPRSLPLHFSGFPLEWATACFASANLFPNAWDAGLQNVALGTSQFSIFSLSSLSLSISFAVFLSRPPHLSLHSVPLPNAMFRMLLPGPRAKPKNATSLL